MIILDWKLTNAMGMKFSILSILGDFGMNLCYFYDNTSFSKRSFQIENCLDIFNIFLLQIEIELFNDFNINLQK